MPALLLKHWPKVLALVLIVGAGVGGYFYGRKQPSNPVGELTETRQEKTQEVERKQVQRARHTVRQRFDPTTGKVLEREETTAGAVIASTVNKSGEVVSTRVSKAADKPWRASALVGVDASTLSLTAPPAVRVGLQVQRDFEVPIVRLPASVGVGVLVTPDMRNPRPEVFGSVGVRW